MELRATYRLQLHEGFTFDHAAALVASLADLGISHLYLSPILQAVAGSMHGYDVVDHAVVSRDLGGIEGFERLVGEVRRHGLGLVVDVVPNHMAVGTGENRWWQDVLEHGPDSVHADWFDVTWASPDAHLDGKVLLPVLADRYGEFLRTSSVAIGVDDGRAAIEVAGRTLPLRPESLALPLTRAATTVADDRLAFVARAVSRLPSGSTPAVREQRAEDSRVLRRLLAESLTEASVEDACAAEFHRISADPDLLHDLLERQSYRLAHWRTAHEDLDYRRFFDVDALVAVRVERPEVFQSTHATLLDLIDRGWIDGLRIDHPDGLRDPAAYLQRLRVAAPDTWIVVEKILEPGEELRPWPVAGTTGYDFLGITTTTLTDDSAAAPLLDLAASLTGDVEPFAQVVARAKHEMLDDVLGADLNRLVARAVAACESHRDLRDATRRDVAAALRALLVACDVYRTYVTADGASLDDRRLVGQMIEAAAKDESTDPDLVEFLGNLLTAGAEPRPGDLDLVVSFQQLSSALMAKSFEDTAFYRYVPLLGLCEVGNDPGQFGRGIADFHRHQARMHRDWPQTMLTVGTHDTKRSADARARLLALSHVPHEWERFVGDVWPGLAADWPHDDDPHVRYVLLQSWVAAWPVDAPRLRTYLSKATKEARRRTSWTDPDPSYDDAVDDLVTDALGDRDLVERVTRFVEDLEPVAEALSFAQTLLLLTCPGVPDVYQGDVDRVFRLVDPDNRQPVEHLPPGVERWTKPWLVRAALDLRRRRPGAFRPGDTGAYVPIDAGPDVLAYTRGDDVAVFVSTRPSTITVDDAVARFAPHGWRDLLPASDTGRPVALLERAE